MQGLPGLRCMPWRNMESDAYESDTDNRKNKAVRQVLEQVNHVILGKVISRPSHIYYVAGMYESPALMSLFQYSPVSYLPGNNYEEIISRQNFEL